MKQNSRIKRVLAITFAIASIVVSCKKGLAEADKINPFVTPLQRVEDMFAVKTKNGIIVQRIEAPLMEHYDTDTTTYDIFPKGLSVYGYTDEGQLETVIVSDNARHETSKRAGKEDLWSAFGHVVIHNVVKLETMETDTIYWDQAHEEIYTDCYVKMYSDDGFMQGYGMRSDDHARNAILHRPFNSYGVTDRDTTKLVIDSVNFIGPFKKKSLNSHP